MLSLVLAPPGMQDAVGSGRRHRSVCRQHGKHQLRSGRELENLSYSSFCKKSRACQDLIRRMKMQDLVVMCLLLPGTQCWKTFRVSSVNCRHIDGSSSPTCFRCHLLWCSGQESPVVLECRAEVRVLCHLVLQRVPSAQTGADISPFGPKLPADGLQAANRSRVKFYADPRMYISTAAALSNEARREVRVKKPESKRERDRKGLPCKPPAKDRSCLFMFMLEKKVLSASHALTWLLPEVTRQTRQRKSLSWRRSSRS